MTVEFRVLGALEAIAGGERIVLGHARQRCVLAVLLVSANELVSVDQLLERAWQGRRPQRGRDVVYAYVSRLRILLAAAGDANIERRSGGYALHVDESHVDVHRFHALVNRARKADRDDHALTLLDEALSLWRGPAFADLDTDWLAAARATLDVEHEAVRNMWADVALRRGRHEEILPTLATRADQRPLDEHAAGQLMLALYRSGRQADALRHYQHLREQLSDELGANPDPDLQELHRQILTAEPGLDLPPSERATHAVAPRQLPPAPMDFIGRAEEIAALTAAINGAVATGRTPVVFTLAGIGGVGKTWLALHWAHQQLDRFPDGQLFVDLQGFSPAGAPVAAAAAAREFLEALGVTSDRVPPDLRGRTALLRSLMADRRMLVVLDNAEDAAQVAPLLPGAAACTVIVTSRRQLAGLVVRHGAQHFSVGTLPHHEARELVTVRLGPERVASEPTALDDVLHVCAGLPLALAIVAARAHIASGSPLSALAAELRDERLRLSALDDEDPTASLPAVLSWSVGSLVPDQATTFALLGIAPGPDIGPAAAASLTGLPENVVGDQLDALVMASLIERTATGRYRMHDLVRLYARGQATGDDARSALRRVTDFYLHTAYGANQILTPYARLPHVDPAVEGCVPLPLTGNAAAMAWFDAEHACVLAAQQAAGGHGWHQLVWVLTRVLNTYHIRRARHGEELASCVAGLAAAQQLGDPTTVIGATRRLGDAYLRVGQRDTALGHLDRALKLAEDIGDQFEQAQTHRFLAMARSGHAEGRQPVEHAERALELYRAVGFAEGEAEALSLVGWLAALQGEYAYARENCLAALPLYRSQDNQDGLAATLDSLGYIGRMTGQHADALDNYEQALSIFRTVGNNYQLPATLDDIGSLHAAMDQPRLARTAWTEAEALYRANGRETDSDRVRKQIADLD